EKHFWETGFWFNYSRDNATTHNRATSDVFNPNVYFRYLKGLNKYLYIGGRIDVFDNYIRIYQNLQNNSVFATAGNYLYASVLYKTNICESWNFQVFADLAVLGIQNEGTAFAMSYSQNRIESGGVDYQDPDMGDPSSYDYAEFKHLGNNFIVKTEYILNYKKRISISYNWEMRRFSVVTDYPTTWGMHNITFRFNIIHKEKRKTSKTKK
ncbi:MAG: hypothetical protein GXO47_03920, partial [Chlorobi bacterium]|nr:hypothetical protein [Chlorobiota bacterium]